MTLQRTDLSRLFIFMEDASDTYFANPVFVDSVEVDGISQSAGDLTLVYQPNGETGGEFDEVAAFRTTKDRSTTTLIVRSTIDEESILAEPHRRKCPFDAHLNIGECLHAASIDQFRKKEVWEDVSLTTRVTSKLASFDSSGIELVTETYGVSIKNRYTVLNPQYTIQEAFDCSDFGTTIGSLVVPPARCCGKAPGSVAFVGSTSGNGMIAYTLNFGKTWEILQTNYPDKLIAGTMYRRWILFAGDAGHVFLINPGSKNFSERLVVAAPTLTGFLSDGTIGVGISGANLYLFNGDAGFASVPLFTNTTSLTGPSDAKREQGFVVLDALNRPVWSKTGTAWFRAGAYADPLLSVPSAIVIRGEGQWIISASDALYYTDDYGLTWTTSDPLAYPGPLYSATRHVLFSAGWDETNQAVRIYRTTNEGFSFYEEPNLPSAESIFLGLYPTRVQSAPEDPNIVWISGSNPSGTPILLGRP